MKTTIILLLSTLVWLFGASSVAAQDEDVECLACHDDHSLVKDRDGITISLFVDYGLYGKTVHAEEGCISCHEDVDPDDLPHEDDLSKVDCSMCHDVDDFESSTHGESVGQGRYLAPTCSTCHSKHNIRSPSDTDSWVHTTNIVRLCSSCHKENVAVADLKPLTSRERIGLEPLEDILHAAGSSLRGLTLTPTCETCHSGHSALPGTDGSSPTHRNNIVATCLTCHGQIEEVHQSVFDGSSWTESLLSGPVCVDCHKPHKRESALVAFSDGTCLSCHGSDGFSTAIDGEERSLHVNSAMVGESVHADLTCVACHTKVDLDHDPVCVDSGPVNCATCHSGTVAQFVGSQHGADYAEGNPIAPYCADCHGTHEIRSHTDILSPTYPRNIPDLCGTCHQEGEQAAAAYTGNEQEIVNHYQMSIHGKGLIESGLIVTATCVDCHTAHGELPATDENSTVHANNIAQTCASCHTGILQTLSSSVHSKTITQTDKKLPTCNDCHSSHEVQRVSEDAFRKDILDQCGTCHEDLTESYFETFHGKVSYLGNVTSARCYDCHGSHNILPKSNPASTLSPENVVETCQKCHSDANVRFTQYLTHADYHDGEKYPRLNFAFLAMTMLLVSVFIFFGAHTLLWFPRALSERKKNAIENGKEGNL